MDALFIGENRFTPALYINNAAKIYKKLNRAYAWTNTQINGNGNAYLVYYDGSNYSKGDAIPAQTILGDNNLDKRDVSLNRASWCIDGKLYHQGGNISVLIDYNVSEYLLAEANMILYISENNLKSYNGVTGTVALIDAGGWQHISSFYQGSIYYGIKNDSLYKINVGSTSTVTLLDDTGIWTEVVGSINTNNSQCVALGIKDKKLYTLYNNTITELSSDIEWEYISGALNSYQNYRTYAIGNNGKLYSINGSKVITLVDDTEIWIKTIGGNTNSNYVLYGLTQSGKLYSLSGSGNSITQLGIKIDWVDISGHGSYIGALDSSGRVYIINYTSNTYTETLIDSENSYSAIVGCYLSTSITFPKLLIYSGNNVVNKHTVYTIGKPDVGFTTYADTNMTLKSTISAVDENSNTITDEYYSYARDPSLDGLFSGISPDTSKQLLTLADILNAMK